MLKIIGFIISFCVVSALQSQNDTIPFSQNQSDSESVVIKESKNDSIKTTKVKQKFKPKPGKALLYSLIPGGGQIYNRKYWYIKAPIIIGGLGFGIYVIADNSKNYQIVKEAYYNRVNNLPVDAAYATANITSLKAFRDGIFSNLQSAYIFTILGYLLSGLEAYTTAHLMDYNISDDLSLRIQPVTGQINTGSYAGIGIKIRF
jgi:Family of unknown function (DUF5683)